MTLGLLAGVLGASLLASAHCAGMCGPFVAFYSVGARSGRAHLVYHGERALMYSALGALAGAVGGGLDLLGERAGLFRVAALVASVLTVLWGALAFVPRARLLKFIPSFLPERLVQLKRKDAVTKAAVLGLTTPLLPCGTLYAFVTLSAGAGGPLEGALVMFVFFLGTLPGLLGLGALSAHIGRFLGARLPRVMGAVLVMVGLFGIYERSRAFRLVGGGEAQVSCHGQH